MDPAAAPPVAFRHIVHYADEQTAEIPVLVDEGVGHGSISKPVGLKSAALAWSARFPGDKSEEEAVVYQFVWTNPRADVAISSIDMAYGKDGDRCGTPALLAVTAARAPRTERTNRIARNRFRHSQQGRVQVGSGGCLPLDGFACHGENLGQ